MRVSVIVAMAANHVIGKDGSLPWHLSEDLKHFKAITMGKPVVMGRLTWESIGRPLPGRENIVLTGQTGYSAEGCTVVGSPAAALAAAGDVEEVMIIGGGQIYDLFMPIVQRIYMTRVATEVDGDAIFPELSEDDWRTISCDEYPATAERELAFRFEILERDLTHRA